MRGHSIIITAMAVGALSLPAQADAPFEPTRGEKLAWHIEAYVPCKTSGGLAELKSEVKAFEATRDEMLVALDILELDDNACNELKRTSGKLLALAMNEPEKFDRTFEFEAQASEDAENTAAAPEVPVQAPVNAGLTQRTVAPPPQAASLKTRSSY